MKCGRPFIDPPQEGKPGRELQVGSKCSTKDCGETQPGRSWKIGDSFLYPGDVLLQVAQGEHAGYTLEEVRSLAIPPIRLSFLHALRVEKMRVLTRSGYTDCHHCFTGFHEKVLSFQPDPPGVEDMHDLARYIHEAQ